MSVLTLRPLRIDDAEAMVTVLADPGLYAFTGGQPPTQPELERRYAVQVRGCSADGSEEWINHIVELGPEQQPIGYVQATITEASRVAELAWVIGAPWQRRGHAGEAVRTLVDELSGRGVRRWIAHIHPEHTASARIAESIGMTATDILVDGEIRWEGANGR